jgi:hypothetical protein
VTGWADDRPDLTSLRLVASAMAGRIVGVAAAEPGERPWTDGATVFVDAAADPAERTRMLMVQTSLIAAGSLGATVVRQLSRHASVARRYLAVEAHRALAANADLLPPAARSLLDTDIAASVASVDESLALARGRHPIPDPPRVFGTIHARRVLAAIERGDAAESRTDDAHTSLAAREVADPTEFVDELDERHLGQLLSSPIGGGGPIGRLLARLLQPTRDRGGSPPGTDAPTHVSRSAPATGGGATVSTTPPATLAALPPLEARRPTYPEWDVHRGRYRPEWCTVVEREAPVGQSSTPITDEFAFRRSLARLGLELAPCRRQPQGDDIDIDAAVEAFVDRRAGSPHADDCYVESLRRRRDLAVLVLLDVSGSAGEPGSAGRPVHEQQRATAAALTVALHRLGDRVALAAFNSRGRRAVHFLRVKAFDDDLDGTVARRLDGLAPAAYTRLGAAIRHGTTILDERGGTARRLLVVLSDGFAYDHGYEGRYGEADARRALLEARRRGVGCLCVSVGARTEPAALRRVFGAAAHAAVARPEQLAPVIGPLFRAAIASAELQRRAFQRRERTRERLEIERRRDGGPALLRSRR